MNTIAHARRTRAAVNAALCIALGVGLGACDSAAAPKPSGTQLWTAGPTALWQPATDGSRVFFQTLDHVVVAVDRASGTRQWAKSVSGAWPYGGNAVVVGNSVIVPSYDVFALDRATGTERWRFAPESQGLPGYAAGAFGIAANDSTVFTGGAGGAYALDARTGAPRWSLGFGVDSTTIVTAPVLDGGTVFLSVRYITNPITGELVAVDARTGAVRWRRTFTAVKAGSGSGPLSVVTTRDLVIASLDDGTIHALGKSSGGEVWSARPPPELESYDDSRFLALVGNTVVATSSTFFTTGYDAETGGIIWRRDAQQGSSASEVATDGTSAYVVFVNGALAKLDGATGEVRWVIAAPPDIMGFLPWPLVDGDVLFAPGHHGVVAIRR